jgi:biopolymer transport protein ExbD
MAKLKIKKNDVWIDMTPMSDVMVLLLTFFMLSANFVKNEVVKVQTPATKTESKVPKNATLDIMIKPDTLNKGAANEQIVGRVYLGTDKVATMDSALNLLLKVPQFKSTADAMNDELRKSFLAETQIGIPMKDVAAYLKKTHEERVKDLKTNAGLIKQGNDIHYMFLDSLVELSSPIGPGGKTGIIQAGNYSEFELWVKAMKIGYKQWRAAYVEKEKPDAIALADIPEELDICIKADKATPYITFRTVISELQDINESHYKLLTQYKKEEQKKQ